MMMMMMWRRLLLLMLQPNDEEEFPHNAPIPFFYFFLQKPKNDPGKHKKTPLACKRQVAK